MEINDRIKELFIPTMDKIKKQSKCNHKWYKDGTAYYQCTECDYLADDIELDVLIFKDKIKGILNTV